MRNYSSARITGSTNLGASNVTEHVASEQHNAAMLLPSAEQVKAARVPIAGHCPIANSLLALKKLMQEKLIKFDICYVIVKVNIQFKEAF